MNKINVETPQEWKNRLYKKTSSSLEKKKVCFKPVTAAISAILVFALTTTAFAFTAMPDFFKGLFQGNDEYLDPLYAGKNIVLHSDTDDLEIICTGIMGDKHNLAVNFAVKSKGNLVFDIGNHYIFETSSFRFESEKSSNDDGYSATFNLNYSDSKTLVGDLYVSGNVGNGFTDKNLKIHLENLECLKPEDNATFERVLDCNFESEIVIDYMDTSKRMSALKTEISCNDIILAPVNSEISNISLNAEFKVIKGDVKNLNGSNPFKEISVAFIDGTVSEFNFEEKSESQNIFYINSVMQTETTYKISGVFGEAVDASKVLSVNFDGTELFTEK